MKLPKIMDNEQLKEQINRYYAGETSPEEEILLHLALLDEPQDSPLKKHLFVIESMMAVAGAAQQSPSSRARTLRRTLYLSVASVAAALAVLLWVRNPFATPTHSYLNGVPLSQEEVTQHAEDAFGILASSLEESAYHSEVLEAKLEKTNHVIDRSMEKLEAIQDNDYFVLTSY